jgi:propanol-preferring alcohol dehydrogenase
MRAMVLKKLNKPLVLEEIPKPSIQDDGLLIKVKACAVCRTDLHILDGELPYPKLPLVLGHEIVGTIEAVGKNVKNYKIGDRVGIPWLGSSCGQCPFCKEVQENLCDDAHFTGYQLNGGFAEYAACRAAYAVPLPSTPSDEHIAPLLCAGVIGYRAYRKASPKKTLGLYGFGASAHIIAQLAKFEEKEVYAFTRKGDTKTQMFAKELGAVWTSDSQSMPPVPLDAAIIFAPAGELVPLSLKALKKGGRCICAGIHMSNIPSFPYKDLWGEKRIESVANLTRQDAQEFFALASRFPIQTRTTPYPLEKTNQALDDLKMGRLEGAAVVLLD